MLSNIILFSLRNKLIVLLFTFSVVVFGVYALLNIPIGAVPDVTNNQIQVITTSRDLATQDVEQFITYPVELEMSNLPGVKEIRSISKFGLSVVTIVFEDRMGTYLPRQLVAEKIKSASEKIPEGFGTPEMGPITTGLGEIYQYVLEVAPEYEDQYSIMDLRSIQDWIVKRQLSGIPGVIEVNTWGGQLKQYEVAINPKRLKAMNIPLRKVFEALENNNSVAGGGYIEKGDQAFFIRGEGLTQNIADIENIIVENRNGIPIYVKNVAKVGLGSATRFGAITGNGEGEKVLGQVMMLKDANSKAVIDAVKLRVKQLESSLPPGVSINAFLERSELIKKTTWTVAENLMLGCLIVIFVVVVLLGNIRSGLVVASIIPLSLLFALTLMYIFGVDANLMSLGAIDFGIIIDGAVIIVEYIAYKITSKSAQFQGIDQSKKQELLDKITLKSASKMMHSAIFGQLIIIIVFIPILSLVNVEGKMFRPMGQTFSFALIGAIIFCFTYVPVVSSLILKPSTRSNRNISNKLITWIQEKYQPVLGWALGHTRWIIGMALSLLLGTAVVFTTLGGEFVPTLDEGDFVIQPVLETGTSLSRTIEITTEIEKIIKSFPEVNQVVTRIGAAEVPTDPMSMEETDVIITLIPKNEWESASSKDELANMIKSELISAIPDVDYEFTQPIEMRFNELITGVRADLAIKVYGEDLDVLVAKADEIELLIADVEGASDITVEKIEGLPQMSLVYDRSKIARYGLNIKDVNDVISMGFAGKVAGTVFEGEKRFDLVTRFDQANKKDISDIKNAAVTTPSGRVIPLSELAEVSYTTGPAKISRDDTRRRTVVSVNVRDRDLESVVDEISLLIDENITFPPGYFVSYGGQFENLQSARERLAYAVPVALILIFFMLYFAFKSIQEVLLVYTAIPLAAVGGVLFLYLRDLPFSISAGVGFIALFGIAVLNGIVLIEHYKELKKKSHTSLKELIIHGTTSRLRPVLLTASAAALGFLPMAVSTSAGAEVQRPLATVVIGGLFTATLLTLLVLPVLYYLLEQRKLQVKMPKAMLLFLLLIPSIGYAQTQDLMLEDAIDLAIKNNAGINAQQLALDRQKELGLASFDFDKTNLYFNYDENNIAPNDAPLRIWGIQQNFRFPTSYSAKGKLNRELVALEQYELEIQLIALKENVSKTYLRIVYLLNLQSRYQALDSIYRKLSSASQKQFESGESNIIDKLTAESKQNEVRLLLQRNESDLDIAFAELKKWIQSDESINIPFIPLTPIALIQADSASNPGVKLRKQQSTVTLQQLKATKSDWLPDISLEYFQGTNDVMGAELYRGFQVGLGVPLIFGTQRSRVRSTLLAHQQSQSAYDDYYSHFSQRRQQLLSQLEKYQKEIDYYDQTGSALSKALISSAQKAYAGGEIDFFKFILTMDRGIQMEIDYLEYLNNYNQTALSINYLTR